MSILPYDILFIRSRLEARHCFGQDFAPPISPSIRSATLFEGICVLRRAATYSPISGSFSSSCSPFKIPDSPRMRPNMAMKLRNPYLKLPPLVEKMRLKDLFMLSEIARIFRAWPSSFGRGLDRRACIYLRIAEPLWSPRYSAGFSSLSL